MSRRMCDHTSTGLQCRTWPAWKVRAKGDSLERNWLYACGRHINRLAQDWASEAGDQLDLIRIRSDE
jgi:hypothetical protein